MLTINSLLFCLFSSFSIPSTIATTPLYATACAATETYVYICESKTAYAYHAKKDCGGLDNCTHKIIRVTLDDAIEYYKRKSCKKCE